MLAAVVDALQEVLDEPLWPSSLVRMKKSFVALSSARQLAPGDDDSIGVLPWAQSLLGGDASDLVRMLVDPSQEERLVAALAMVPGEDVGCDRRVRVPDVRGRVHVVDRRRHVEAHLQG